MLKHQKDGLSKLTNSQEINDYFKACSCKLFSFSVELRRYIKKGWLEPRIGYKSMSKKDKKIEIQINDAKVVVNKATIEGFELLVGKKVIGQIVEIDGKFAVVDKENVVGFHKKMDDAVAAIIESYNLNH